jgi:excisionase family DNA binding protein
MVKADQNKVNSIKYFITRQETADMLGLSLATIGRRIKDGSIPSKKIGSRILVPTEAIERMVSSALESAKV